MHSARKTEIATSDGGSEIDAIGMKYDHTGAGNLAVYLATKAITATIAITAVGLAIASTNQAGLRHHIAAAITGPQLRGWL